jgi:hypothetical protein
MAENECLWLSAKSRLQWKKAVGAGNTKAVSCYISAVQPQTATNSFIVLRITGNSKVYLDQIRKTSTVSLWEKQDSIQK